MSARRSFRTPLLVFTPLQYKHFNPLLQALGFPPRRTLLLGSGRACVRVCVARRRGVGGRSCEQRCTSALHDVPRKTDWFLVVGMLYLPYLTLLPYFALILSLPYLTVPYPTSPSLILFVVGCSACLMLPYHITLPYITFLYCTFALPYLILPCPTLTTHYIIRLVAGMCLTLPYLVTIPCPYHTLPYYTLL